MEDLLVKYTRHVEERNNNPKEDKDFNSFLNWFNNIKLGNESIQPSFIGPCNPTHSKMSKREEKQIDGTVTSINEDHGLIDNYIYFNKEIVNSFNTITVGDAVTVYAFRNTNYHGWRAQSVNMRDKSSSNGWHESNSLFNNINTMFKEQGSMIGVVTSLTDIGGIIENEVNFSFNDMKDLGLFIPKCGDWIKANVDENNKATGIQPLRQNEITGTITRVPRWQPTGSGDLQQNSGTINDEVTFTLPSCQADYIPHVGDVVLAKVIESRQGKYTWRALSIDLIERSKPKALPAKGSYSGKDWCLKGERPQRKGPEKATVPSFLPQYALPVAIYNCIFEGRDILKHLPAVREELTCQNYAKKFSALLYLEETATKIDIAQYNLKDVCMESHGEFLSISVPGLIDGRPDLAIGDTVTLQDCKHSKFNPDYQGFIHHISAENEYILVKFHRFFHENFDPNDKFNIYFTYSRTPFRRCHLAVNFAHKRFVPKKLFHFEDSRTVSNHEKPTVLDNSDLHIFNKQLNERQKYAVGMMVKADAKLMPYILFGPPGTGKTITIVEFILQVCTKSTFNRILVCAPSNSAVDLLCERLHDGGVLKAADMIRFNGLRRPEECISETVQLYCKPEEEIERVAQYRILLTTCVNAGVLYNVKLRKNHFTHLCIDEAGQATEPETLIPIGLCHTGVIIMAGDPMQLGPVIKSPLALHYGLNHSLLERLMSLPNYKRNSKFGDYGYNPLLVTKLLKNYRVVHPKLLQLSSQLFYDNELIAAIPDWDNCAIRKFSELPNINFPMIFHGIIGKELRELGSPSWMNPAEIVQVIRYVKLLQTELNIPSSEIGIISPYRKQVQKLRSMLFAINVQKVKVGTVEEFQGQERSVILISTVRSRTLTENASGITINSLGFVGSSKRFNVSITRSRFLTIIIGNPFVLMTDSNWNCLLNMCVDNNAYVGCNLLVKQHP